MPTVAPVKEGKSFPPAPAGTHVARIYRFMNLGTRFQEYQGKMKDYPDTLVTFTLELSNELNEFEYEDKETGKTVKVSKPYAISREFTLSMGSKSNLRPFVEGVIGTKLTDEEAGAFDIETLVGKSCLATVTHVKSKDGEKTYANLTTVSPLVKGMAEPEPVNEAQIQDVKTMTEEEINALPQFLQTKIKDSDEWKARFDPFEIERKNKLQENINTARGDDSEDGDTDNEEIKPEDIPF